VLLGKLEAEKEKRLEETKQRRAAEESMYVYKKTTVLLILTIVMGPSWSLSYGCSISVYHHSLGRKYNSCQILINGMTKIYLTEKLFVIWNYT
jgi:hypothetical protein